MFRSKTTDVSYSQYDRFTLRLSKGVNLIKRARRTTNFRNLNYLLLWRYTFEKTKRVRNRYVDKDSKTREKKVDQIYTSRKIKKKLKGIKRQAD